jgi:hypothetical protein
MLIVLATSQVVLATESASDEGYLGQQYASSMPAVSSITLP